MGSCAIYDAAQFFDICNNVSPRDCLQLGKSYNYNYVFYGNCDNTFNNCRCYGLDDITKINNNNANCLPIDSTSVSTYYAGLKNSLQCYSYMNYIELAYDVYDEPLLFLIDSNFNIWYANVVVPQNLNMMNEIHLNLIKKTNPNVKKIYPAMQQKMLN
jgi:hypothetical protein